MIIINKKCIDSAKCHSEIALKFPDCIGIDHIDNNHIVCFANDTSETVESMGKTLGSVEHYIDGEKISYTPTKTQQNLITSKKLLSEL